MAFIQPRIAPYWSFVAATIVFVACFGELLHFKLVRSIFDADPHWVRFKEFVPSAEYVFSAVALAATIGAALVKRDAKLLAKAVTDANDEFQPRNLPMMTLRDMALDGTWTAELRDIWNGQQVGEEPDAGILARMVILRVSK